MSVPTTFLLFLKDKYGSMQAIDAAHEADENAQLRDYHEWSLALCEHVGIPWHGWTENALYCARKRLEGNPAEIDIVRSLNNLHNDETHRSAMDLYLLSLTGLQR